MTILIKLNDTSIFQIVGDRIRSVTVDKGFLKIQLTNEDIRFETKQLEFFQVMFPKSKRSSIYMSPAEFDYEIVLINILTNIMQKNNENSLK